MSTISTRSTLDVLVIGAARSGTTALMSELGRHPDVFVTDPKETNFFAYSGAPPQLNGTGDGEMVGRSIVTDPAELEELVARGSDRLRRAEGSVSTLYRHETSIPNIDRYASPDTRLIAVLRSPAERAFSSYLYLVGRGHETAPDFETALALEDDRVQQGWHHLWHYRRMSHYGPQLEAFVRHFGRDRLHIALHDDFERDPETFLAGVLEFVDVDPVALPSTRLVDVNRGGVPRSEVVRRASALLRRSQMLERGVKAITTQTLRERIRSANLHRPPLAPATRSTLANTFEADITAVEDLTGRSMPHWRA